MAGPITTFADALMAAQAQKRAGELEASRYADKMAQQQFMNDLELKKLDIMRQKAENPSALVQINTPGRKAADVAFGKEYTDWSSGGFAGAQKGLQALKEAQQALGTVEKPAEDISGGVRGLVPDVIRNITNPKAIAVKENIRGAVMNTLRATLGAQFTEKEGERIFNLAYNDRLPAEENIKRLNRIMGELENMTQAKQSMADYFEQYGTLTGWQGRMPVIGDESQAPAGIQTPAPDAKMQRLMELRAKAAQR